MANELWLHITEVNVHIEKLRSVKDNVVVILIRDNYLNLTKLIFFKTIIIYIVLIVIMIDLEHHVNI